MIKEELKILCEEIKKKHDLIDYIKSRNIEIYEKRSGDWIVCPFHNDKNPSLRITKKDDYSIWYCFGCKKCGTIIHFYAYHNNITIGESIKRLGTGIDVELDLESLIDELGDNEEDEEVDVEREIQRLNSRISIECFQYLRAIRVDHEELFDKEFVLIDKFLSKIDGFVLSNNLEELADYYEDICDFDFLVNRLKVI